MDSRYNIYLVVISLQGTCYHQLLQETHESVAEFLHVSLSCYCHFPPGYRVLAAPPVAAGDARERRRVPAPGGGPQQDRHRRLPWREVSRECGTSLHLTRHESKLKRGVTLLSGSGIG